MKLLKSFVIIGFLSTVGIAVAMNIETGKEFPADRDQKTGEMIKSTSQAKAQALSTPLGHMVSKALTKLQELFDYIVSQTELFDSMTSENAKEEHQKKMLSEVKSRFEDVKESIRKAENVL